MQAWDDDYLIWKPKDYDNVEQLVLSPTEIWYPDLGVENRQAAKAYTNRPRRKHMNQEHFKASLSHRDRVYYGAPFI